MKCQCLPVLISIFSMILLSSSSALLSGSNFFFKFYTQILNHACIKLWSETFFSNIINNKDINTITYHTLHLIPLYWKKYNCPVENKNCTITGLILWGSFDCGFLPLKCVVLREVNKVKHHKHQCKASFLKITVKKVQQLSSGNLVLPFLNHVWSIKAASHTHNAAYIGSCFDNPLFNQLARRHWFHHLPLGSSKH